MKTVESNGVGRFVKYDGEFLWLRVDGIERNLGRIFTKQGGLTREEKLKSVASRGEWVKI